MDGLSFMALVMACAPLVDPGTARALVEVESAFNPNAIGVVGGALERQPRSKAQALATTRALQEHGWNFSIGLAQINVRNLRRLNLTIDAAFDPCSNLMAMQSLLEDCFERASHSAKHPQHSLREAQLRFDGDHCGEDITTHFERSIGPCTPSLKRTTPAAIFGSCGKQKLSGTVSPEGPPESLSSRSPVPPFRELRN